MAKKKKVIIWRYKTDHGWVEAKGGPGSTKSDVSKEYVDKQDSILDHKILNVNNALTQEIEERIASDDELRELLNLEKDTRVLADEALDIKITEEAQARESGDNELLAAINLKQDLLTLDQLRAVNSGIKHSDVEQIASNKSSIQVLNTKVDGLSSIVSIKVEATLPTTPVKNTLYYIGTASPYHKYLVDSSGKVEDLGDGEVNLDQYYKKNEIAELLDEKLSLTGGTIDGELIVNDVARLAYVAANIMGPDTDDYELDLLGGATSSSGANIQLFGKDVGSNGGIFRIWAHNGAKSCALIGKPDKTLTWGGKNILTEVGGKITGAFILTNANNLARRETDDNSLNIFGGTNNRGGANLWLIGKSAANNPGTFALNADDGTNRREFIGWPSGALTWDNKDVITSTSNSGIKKIWKGTLAEYEALTDHPEGVEYHITDDNQLLFDCLPKAGGTMSGPIYRNGYLAHGVDNNSGVYMSGGKDGYLSGASFELYGKGNTAGAGKFVLVASNGSAAPALQGLPNGALSWDGKVVPTVVSTYVNGTSDINGNFNLSAVRPAGTSFPIGFLQANMGTETARYCFMCGGYYMSFSNSGTVWEAWANAHVEGTIFWAIIK